MTCEIPYLDNKYQGVKLITLRKKHFSIIKQITDSKLFYKKDGKFVLNSDRDSKTRKNQEEFVKTIPELSIVKLNKLDTLSLKVDRYFEDDSITNYFLPQEKNQEDVIYNYATQSQFQDSNIESYFNNGKTTVETILTKIKNPALKVLVIQLQKHLTEKQKKIPVELSETLSARGLFASDKIFISKNAKFPKGSAEKTILHEILHPMTLQFLDNNKDSKLYKDFEKLYNHAHDTLVSNGKPYYGLSSIEEFIVEALSNGEFIAEMLKMDAIELKKYNNLFEEFLDILGKLLKKLFYIKDDNLYNQVISVASNIILENTDLQYKNLELDTFDDDFNVYYDVDNETIRETHEFSSYLNESEENESKFLSIVGDLKKRFNDYITLLSDNLVDYPSDSREIKIKELKALRKQLNTESIEDAVIGLSNYVTHAVQWIDVIHNDYFKSDKNVMFRYKNLHKITDEKEKQQEIYELTKIINKSTQFLYLFQGLNDFKEELQRDSFIPKDKFNTKFYEDKTLFMSELAWINLEKADLENLYKMLEKDIEISEIKNTIIASKNFTDYQEILDFSNKLNETFNKNVKNTFTSQMSLSLGKAEELKSQIKDLHFKLTTEFLFPEFDLIQQKNKEVKETISKKQFEALLKVADKDESYLTSWLEATIQSNDPLVAMVAKKMSNAMYDVHTKNVKTAGKISELRKPILEKTRKEQKEIYDDFTNLIYVLKEDDYGNPIELSPDDDRPSITFDTYTGKKRYLLQEASAFKTGKNTAKAESYRKLVNNILFKEKIGDDYGLLKASITAHKENNLYEFLANGNIPELGKVVKELFHTVNGELGSPIRYNNDIYLLEGDIQTKAISDVIKAVLLKELYHKKVTKDYNVADTTKVLNEQGITLDNYEQHLEYLKQNTTRSNSLYDFLNKARTIKGQERLVNYLSMLDSNGEERFMVEILKGKDKSEIVFLTLDEIITTDSGIKRMREDIKSVYYKKYDLVGLQSDFKLNEYNGKYPELFKEIYSVYQENNKKLGYKRLKHGIKPQVQKTGILDLKEGWEKGKSLFQSILDFFVDSYASIRKALKGFNEEVAQNEYKSIYENEYLNGEKIKNIGISYTSIFDNQDNVEWDLALSVSAYSFMVNQHEVLKQYDPQMRVVRAMVTGDTMLGIEARKANKVDSSNKYIRKTRSRKDEDNYKKELAKNLNGKLIEFIDEMMYSEADYLNFSLGNTDLNKIAGALSGYTTYTNLALNIMGMLSNITNGKVATYLEGIQGDYFTQKEHWEAEKEYILNMHHHYKDFVTVSLEDKSKIGQLLIMLDAIQGEYLDDFKSVMTQTTWQDAPKTALYFTQNGAEHWIQTVNMIAMLKADGLWDEIKHTPGQLITFTKEQEAKLRVFQGKLHSVNKRLNGAYAKIDKSRLQRRWFGRMILMFRKYIWQAYKARFQNERLDVESTDVVRGYVTGYYSDLIKDLKSNQSIAWKALRTGKQVLQDNRRLLLGVGNLATGGLLNKNINVKSAYGLQNKSDKEIAEAQRYIAEMSMFVAFTIVGAFLGSFGDDDDDNLALDNLELLMKRQRSDMGAFLPTMLNIPTMDISAFATFTFIKKTVTSPIPSMRSVDNSISVLKQLTGVELGESDLNFTFNDVYDKKGAGHEKGDLKLTKKLDKSLISPYWQILKLLSPKEQLQYLEMINKNSI